MNCTYSKSSDSKSFESLTAQFSSVRQVRDNGLLLGIVATRAAHVRAATSLSAGILLTADALCLNQEREKKIISNFANRISTGSMTELELSCVI